MEDLVEIQVKLVNFVLAYAFFDITSLYSVDSCLDDGPGAVGGEEAVQELGKCNWLGAVDNG